MTQPQPAQYKRQHYVPQFLLRKFAVSEAQASSTENADGPSDASDANRISLYIFKADKFVDGAKINRQCYEDYFYGKDGIMEKSFGDEETLISNLLKTLEPNALEKLSDDAKSKIKMFMHYQAHRTIASGEHINAFVDAYIKELMKPAITEMGFKEEHLDLVTAKSNAPQQESLLLAASSGPLTWDLDLKFLVRAKPPFFVISDHPVTAYNQFVEHHPKLKHCLGLNGIGVKGIQQFLPLSPHVCAAVFDPLTYSYGSNKSQICQMGDRDVHTINRLQAIYAWECLYFAGGTSREYIRELAEISKKYDIHSARVRGSAPRIRPDGLRSKQIENSAAEVRLGAKFSFARVIDQMKYPDHNSYGPPVRSAEMIAFCQELGRRLRDGTFFDDHKSAAGGDQDPPDAAE